MNSRPNYEKCKQIANRLLMNQDDLEIDPNIYHLKSDRKIIIISIQEYCRLLHINRGAFMNEDGRLIKGVKIYDHKNDIYTILYNESVRRHSSYRWDIAHELGHLFLDHIEETEKEETEANVFARQLLMPEYSVLRLMRDYEIRNVNALAYIFRVSETIARYRIENLKHRGCIRISSDDISIWEMQKNTAEDRIREADRYYELDEEVS